MIRAYTVKVELQGGKDVLNPDLGLKMLFLKAPAAPVFYRILVSANFVWFPPVAFSFSKAHRAGKFSEKKIWANCVDLSGNDKMNALGIWYGMVCQLLLALFKARRFLKFDKLTSFLLSSIFDADVEGVASSLVNGALSEFI